MGKLVIPSEQIFASLYRMINATYTEKCDCFRIKFPAGFGQGRPWSECDDKVTT